MIDKETWETLMQLYGEWGATMAAKEIEYWQVHGRLPEWTHYIQQIIVENDNVIYVHRDNRKQD